MSRTKPINCPTSWNKEKIMTAAGIKSFDKKVSIQLYDMTLLMDSDSRELEIESFFLRIFVSFTSGNNWKGEGAIPYQLKFLQLVFDFVLSVKVWQLFREILKFIFLEILKFVFLEIYLDLACIISSYWFN